MSDVTLPGALTARPQWVCWTTRERDGKPTKVPLDPRTGAYASVRDPETWADFDVAMAAADDDAVAGVGFVFTDDDPFVGVDLDDCRDPETTRAEPWARDIVETLDSYTEVSPSGTGFHVYVRGTLPEGGNRSGRVECYETARFFTVTGQWVGGTPTDVEARTDELDAIHAAHVATSTTAAEPTVQSSVPDSDDALLERAMAAKNGEKFTRLWRGDTSGYESHSEADMALCFLLAFWTQRDVGRMDRLFRHSGLYRQKWDERHYLDGATYGARTVERAARETTDVYVPRTDPEPTDAPTQEGDVTGGVDISIEVSTLQREVDVLEAAVADLRSEIASLEAHHEYLYDELQEEHERHDRTRTRLRELESIVAERRRSWFSRFF